MGTVSVRRLLLTMGIPMMISLAVQSLYNIVDTIFVSNMSATVGNAEAALNALTLAFPIQTLMIAISVGAGVGANALLSRSLGQGDEEKANATVGNILFCAAVIYVICALFGIFFVPYYVSACGNSDPVVNEYTTIYLRICCIASPGIVFYDVYEKILQSTGKSVLTTIAQVTGAVTNIILDPILIYEWGAGMGITGAAIATVISQFVSLGLVMTFHFTRNKKLKNSLKYWRPRASIMGQIFAVGGPAIVAQAVMSFMTMGMNLILVKLDNAFFLVEIEGALTYTGSYTSAYGTFFKIQQFVSLIAFGLRDAITPICSYNRGAGNKKRVQQCFLWGLVYMAIIMVICTAVVELAATPLIGLFESGFTDTTYDICLSAARIISISFIFAGMCIAMQGIFQALGGGVQTLVVSVCRQLVFVLPLVYLFVWMCCDAGSLDGDFWIWVTFIISEAASCLMAAIMTVLLYRKKVRIMPDEPPAKAEDAEEASEPAEAASGGED